MSFIKIPQKAKQIFLATGAILGWLALTLQLYLIIVNRTASVPETIIRFLASLLSLQTS